MAARRCKAGGSCTTPPGRPSSTRLRYLDSGGARCRRRRTSACSSCRRTTRSPAPTRRPWTSGRRSTRRTRGRTRPLATAWITSGSARCCTGFRRTWPRTSCRCRPRPARRPRTSCAPPTAPKTTPAARSHSLCATTAGGSLCRARACRRAQSSAGSPGASTSGASRSTCASSTPCSTSSVAP